MKADNKAEAGDVRPGRRRWWCRCADDQRAHAIDNADAGQVRGAEQVAVEGAVHREAGMGMLAMIRA